MRGRRRGTDEERGEGQAGQGVGEERESFDSLCVI